MFDIDLLANVKYVIDSRGKKAAVQVDVKAWDALLAYMEDLEDQALVKDKLASLREGSAQSGAVSWQDASGEW
jgi:PHD/YefM family antitoxin component YafN of YafNO toxin-antitoxin module